MDSYDGNCGCGKVTFSLSLPKLLDQYSPRKCDCDFCVARDIAYLSDPEGLLDIECSEPLDVQRQGSDQAEFVSCPHCKSVIAATFQAREKRVGAVNAALLQARSALGESMVVSPKVLTPAQKVARWQTLWLTVKMPGGARR